MQSVIFISLALSTFQSSFLKDERWINYKEQYNKQYLNRVEEVQRYNNFKANDEKIRSHNEKYAKGETGFLMGHNQFSDMTVEEMRKTYTSQVFVNNFTDFGPSPFTANPFSSNKAPNELSYKEFCLTPLNQQSCGSCWAFAAAAQVEAQLKRKNPSFQTYLSTQYILDCSKAGTCGGGWSDGALAYLQSSGLVSMNDYPYVGQDQPCMSYARKMPEKISTFFANRISGDENLMMETLFKFGPVVIYIQVVDSFYHYSRDVYWDKTCDNTCETMNHAVLLVGYGTDTTTYDKPVDYWLVKNSWGTGWGESGYFKVLRNWSGMKNQCNVACHAIFSVV